MPIKIVLLVAILSMGFHASCADAKKEEAFKMKSKVVEAAEGVFRCKSAPMLLVGKSLLKFPACLPLQERLEKQFGGSLQPQAPEWKLPEKPFILAGLLKDHPALRKLESDLKSKLPAGGLGDEGYLIEVAPAHVLIAASRPAGVFHGVLKLLEMARDSEWEIPAAKVADWPVMKWRGMHIGVGGRSALPAVEQIITRFATQYRINQLILEINYHFQFKSHPEIAEGDALTVQDCRRLSDLAQKSFVRLIPMINCLGHQSWAKQTFQLLKAHPEFDETPDLPADNPGIYCRSWCPLHPDVNRVVFDLFDEMIDAFRATAFHVGMDEVFILGGKDYRLPGEGQCPRCTGKDNAELFAKAVNDYHKHLVGKRKVEMLMWGDRLLDSKEMPYGEWEASANGTAPAIKLIPKDIVMCDWHYEKMQDFPSVKHFQDRGFRVWPSGWNSEENARLLAGCALKNMGEKMVGYMATTWCGAEAVASGLAGDEKLLSGNKTVAGVVDAIHKGMQMAWEGE